MNAGDWMRLCLLSLLWGGSFFFNAVAVVALPVFTVVVARVAIAALLLNAALPLMGQRMPRDPKILGAFLVMGFANNAVPFSLIVWGQTQLASGAASILNAATPLFTVVFAHLLTRDERLTVPRLAGVVAGLAGVAVMMGGAAGAGSTSLLPAQLACLGAAMSYALASLWGRRFRAMGVAPVVTATGQVTASSLLLLPVLMVVDRPWTLPMPSLPVLAALLGLAVLSTAVAYLLYFRLLTSAGATNLSLVTFLVPVAAILLGVGLLGEVLLPRHLAGMALIGLGLSAIDGRPWLYLRRSASSRRGMISTKLQGRWR
ncbi:EamA family transporter [Aquicoccus sp. SCR17]|nr:EamA family transporter [Carideicomes alvinocaridis]